MSSAEATCWRIARTGRSKPGHQHHRLDAGERVARRVGVDRRQRAVVARVHGLQHVERLGAADLADDDAVGPHAQRVAHELADRRSSPSPSMFGGRDSRRITCRWCSWSSAASSIVTMRSASGIDDGERVQERRLAGAGAAGDDDVEPALHAAREELDGLRRDVPIATRSSEREALLARTCGS